MSLRQDDMHCSLQDVLYLGSPLASDTFFVPEAAHLSTSSAILSCARTAGIHSRTFDRIETKTELRLQAR